MKTAVSIPDDLFARADALAKASGKSRSQVYQEALAEYVRRHDPAIVTGALDEVAAELGADAWVAEAGKQTLERSEW